MTCSKEEEMPSAVLRVEHRVILRVIGVLKRLVERTRSGKDLEIEPLARCVDFFRHFADACHHAKEESLLFPALEARGIPRENGPIGVMLQEHVTARGLTRDMGDALDAARRGEDGAQDGFLSAADQYIDLLSHHIFKEDNILYPMGDRVLLDSDQQTLCRQFCDVQCKTFDGRKREELERIADELEAQWPGPA